MLNLILMLMLARTRAQGMTWVPFKYFIESMSFFLPEVFHELCECDIHSS